MPEEGASEFVQQFRALPIRERTIMFELLFTDKSRDIIAIENMVSVNRLLQIETECKSRLGLS